MKTKFLLGSMFVAAFAAAPAMATDMGTDGFHALGQMSGSVAAMAEGQLAAVEGAGGGGGSQICESGASATGAGLVSLLSGINALNCSPIAINLSVLSAGAGSATAIVNAQ